MQLRKPQLKTENWGQYTRDARDYLPCALDYPDEAPWPQSHLAAMLGVEPNYVSMVERGEREPGRQYKRTLVYVIALASKALILAFVKRGEMITQEEVDKLYSALARAQKAQAEEYQRAENWRAISFILGLIIVFMWVSRVISYW